MRKGADVFFLLEDVILFPKSARAFLRVPYRRLHTGIRATPVILSEACGIEVSVARAVITDVVVEMVVVDSPSATEDILDKTRLLDLKAL